MDWHEIWYYIFLCSNRMTLSLLLVPPVRQSGHEVSESWASTKWISTKTHIYGSQVMIPEFSDPLIFPSAPQSAPWTDDDDGDDSADSLTCNSVQPFWNWITNLLVKLWSTQATQMCHQRDIYSGVVSISAQLSRGQYPGQKHVMWTWCAVFCANVNMVHIHIQMGTCRWCAEMFTTSILSWWLTGRSPKVLHFVWFIVSVHSPEEGGTS